MATTITVPKNNLVGPQAALDACIQLATAAVVDVNALQARATSLESGGAVFKCRGACTTAETLASFDSVTGGTIRDGVTYAAGDVVLLANQVTTSQNGPWVVGAVAAGVAPLTRPAWFANAAVLPAGMTFEVSEGTLFAKSTWKITTAGAITVDTTTFAVYPRIVTQSIALTSGTATISNVPVLSATKTGFAITRRVATTSTLTVGGYCVSTGGANGVTAGVVGTAAVIIEACVGAGTINNADASTLEVSIINW